MIFNKKGISLLLVVFLSGCFGKKSHLEKEIIAKVDTQVFSLKEFSERLAFRLKNFDALHVKSPRLVSREKEKIVESFVFRAICQIWAAEKEIKISKEELDAAINHVRSQYPNDLSFRRNLASEYLSFEAWKESLLQTLLQKKIITGLVQSQTLPSEKEMRDFYNENLSLFKRPRQIKVRQLVTDRKDKADLLLKKIRSGKKMAELSEFSISPEKENGGKTDWIDVDTLDIFKKAYRLREGSYSPVLKSPFGFHIIQVLGKRRAGSTSFDAAKGKIQQLLLEKKERELYSQWLDEQIRQRKIYKNEKLITATTVHVTEE